MSVFVDVHSQRVWAFKHKTHGTARTTIAGLEHIAREFRAPDAFMTDGGSHFDNKEVRAWCEERGVDLHIIAAYSPWVNGLGEGTNGKMLGRLKRRCAPELGEDGWEKVTTFEDLPKNWPDHLDEALSDLNDRILPALHYSPNEILTGNVVNTIHTPVADAVTEPGPMDVDRHIAYARQQQLDTQAHTAKHAAEREASFNAKIEGSRVNNIITFRINDLVQVYRNDLDYTFKTKRKFLPKWGAVRRVVARNVNSYKLATLEGLTLKGHFSAHRLWRFQPRKGTKLDEAQRALAAATELIRKVDGLDDEEEEDVPEEGAEDPDELLEDPREDEMREPEDQHEERGGTDGGEDDAAREDERDQIDDGLPLAGWGVPGRLRTRHSRQS